MSMSNESNLKGRFLTAIGYVPSEYESMDMAFDRLRVESPDMFPVPRDGESFWDAITKLVKYAEGDGHHSMCDHTECDIYWCSVQTVEVTS